MTWKLCSATLKNMVIQNNNRYRKRFDGLTEPSATVLTSIRNAENIFTCDFANSYLNNHLHLQIKLDISYSLAEKAINLLSHNLTDLFHIQSQSMLSMLLQQKKKNEKGNLSI